MYWTREKKVLHVGCGPRAKSKLHAAFSQRNWREIRIDIDEKVQPDIVGSMVDIRDSVKDGTYDAIWSSHNIEHLSTHEVPLALSEFRRALRPDGFALITCPDVTAIARLIIKGRFEEPIYQSAAGPISAVDMLWGHTHSIALGSHFMAHRTGFTVDSLGKLLMRANFDEAWVFPGGGYDLWAVALMEETQRDVLRDLLARSGLHLPIEP